jgi:SAM-dependent methyltransferase
MGCSPNIASCDGLDIAEGAAEEILTYLPRHSYDFVYSSHRLEHMRDPARAISNWFELMRPYGFLCVVIPDEDLYEQGVWPSRFNASSSSYKRLVWLSHVIMSRKVPGKPARPMTFTMQTSKLTPAQTTHPLARRNLISRGRTLPFSPLNKRNGRSAVSGTPTLTSGATRCNWMML